MTQTYAERMGISTEYLVYDGQVLATQFHWSGLNKQVLYGWYDAPEYTATRYDHCVAIWRVKSWK